MKRIIFLIVLFMSFSAKADMKFLWGEESEFIKVSAYCIFESSKKSKGTIYLLTEVAEPNPAVSLTPYVQENITKNNGNPYVNCYRR